MRAESQGRERMSVQPPKEHAWDDDWRLLITEACQGKCTFKRTMAIELSSPMGLAVGEQQLKVQPMRREGWTPQKLDEVASTSA
jgi:hypothetical protein